MKISILLFSFYSFAEGVNIEAFMLGLIIAHSLFLNAKENTEKVVPDYSNPGRQFDVILISGELKMKYEQMENIYYKSVNNAMDYINLHYSEKITLEMLANQGNFSAWHFHRIFCGIVGETPNVYIVRIRLERAKMLLNQKYSMTEIAFATGFASSSHFAQSFKKQYNISPKQWNTEKTVNSTTQNQKTKKFNKDVTYTIKTIKAFQIAYVRYIGSYDKNLGTIWKTIMAWARKNNIITDSTFRLSYSWDSPDITPDGKLRYDACISLPVGGVDDALRNGTPVTYRTIEGGSYAVFPFEGTIAQLSAFYDTVYGAVLPKTSFRLGEAPGYRIHLESGIEQALGICRQQLWVPLI
jgi:AraC family transcriptional regulator